MNRTTVRIEPRLLKEAKQIANEKDLNFQQIVNWALEILIGQLKNQVQTKKSEWPTAKLGKDTDKLILDKDFIYGPGRI
ncbi:hypothetical protein COV25_02020 [candidate division WWE3 bacterium CG10_big_fil_rev_8_21_14_0_10_35_32]|nr:MAG: hypothetical protein COV25_02020 [candidate division WWE3 bacterium CG10_big_fil_rev_8_21_14_0_10_35_32]